MLTVLDLRLRQRMTTDSAWGKGHFHHGFRTLSLRGIGC